MVKFDVYDLQVNIQETLDMYIGKRRKLNSEWERKKENGNGEIKKATNKQAKEERKKEKKKERKKERKREAL